MRKYLISFLCLIAIVGLLLVLLRPWASSFSSDWPDTTKESIVELEFSGGQNFSLSYQEGRWYVKEGVYQSLAGQKRVKLLLEQINQTIPFTELPEAASIAEQSLNNYKQTGVESSSGVLDKGLVVNSIVESKDFAKAQQQKNSTVQSFGPDLKKPESLPGSKPDDLFYDESILPTSVTLRGDNTWTIEPQVFVHEAGLVSTRLIKNDSTQIVYLDPLFMRLLSRPPSYYADLNLFSARPERVLSIEIKSPGAEVWGLEKLTEGTFTFLQPERFKGIEVAQAGMEFYLHAVLSTQSPTPFFIDPPEDLEEPFLMLKTVQSMPNISTGTEKEEEYLAISRGKKSGDSVGYSSYQSAYFMISAEKVGQLGRSLLSLRSRPVLPNGIGSVQSARLTIWDSQGEEQVREFTRTDGGWSEFDSLANLIGVDTVFWRLSTLQTDGKRDEALPEDLSKIIRWQFEYAEDKPTLSLTFYANPKEAKHHWVRLNDEGSYFPVHFGVINEILSLLPAPSQESN